MVSGEGRHSTVTVRDPVNAVLWRTTQATACQSSAFRRAGCRCIASTTLSENMGTSDKSPARVIITRASSVLGRGRANLESARHPLPRVRDRRTEIIWGFHCSA